MGGMIAARIRTMAGLHWLALFALLIACWAILFVVAVPADLRLAGQIYGADFWRGLCRATPDWAGFVRVSGMWILMTAAMMAPTALPAFATYDDLPAQHPRGFARLVAGYLVVWIGFSLLAAGLQIGLVAADLVTPFGDSRSALLTAGLLALAGFYQFSALKADCLSACRSPLMHFLQHWEAGAFGIGLRLGLTCLGCCWALMLLAFVGGVMNLAFMGVAMALMTLEKLPEIGRYVTRPLGGLMIAAALWTAITWL
ncbi:MAG: DUF2182 domain-containing protein [Marinibacterium sp.]